METADVTFIQADSFERVISLLEQLYEDSMTTNEVAEMMQFDPRQSDYYFNAGRYLGLFEKVKDENKGSIVMQLTTLGKDVYNLDYKDRQLKLVELILEHKIFNDLFSYVFNKQELPSKEMVRNKMREYNVCSENLINRRFSSVIAWIKWIFNLPNM